MSYDKNGLELSPSSDSMNTYKFTAVNKVARNYSAYAQSERNRGFYSMQTIATFEDPRDAAFVGQEFNKKYNNQQIYQMLVDGIFKEIAEEFVECCDIPVWKYEAEGLSFDDILGGKYSRNYVENARDALLEAIKVNNIKQPNLQEAKKMIASVEQLVASGMNYRDAARSVVTSK